MTREQRLECAVRAAMKLRKQIAAALPPAFGKSSHMLVATIAVDEFDAMMEALAKDAERQVAEAKR